MLESLQTCHKIKKNARKILQNQESARKSIKMSQNRENSKKSRKIQNLKKCWKMIENL